MSIKVPTNRFIVSSLRAGFYQELLKGTSGFRELGKKLVREIETAQAVRQSSRVEESASILGNLPIKEFQLIGQYYEAWGQKENARGVFERVAEESRTYKSKALLSLAVTEAREGKFDEELRYFREALKMTNNPSLIVEASRGTAVVRAKEEDHKQAIKEFEKTLPLVRHTDPIFYYQFLNSYAVELAEVERLEEARNISNIVLASPYAFAYPEWRETSDEIDFRGYHSRSVISLTQVVSRNIVALPERNAVSESTKQPGKLLYYTDWIKKMVKEPNGNDEEKLPDDMTAQDMAMKLVELITENKEEDDKLRQILDYAIKVFSKK
ncbi:MAG TPA: tetratricopeptide repeat protein [Blastocatellia bacterium]|nr:tetratricopeptide repeat protein [Blastocatellia bacterium]